MHWNARLVARGSRTTPPWVHDMIGGWLCTHILQIHCHALSCSLLQQTRIQQQQLVGQPEKLAGRPLFLAFCKKSGRQVAGRPKLVGHPPTGLPRWSFSFLELGARFWGQMKIEANRGIALDFQTRRPDMHASFSLWGSCFIAFLSCHA